MKKSQLKTVIKPIVEECLNEVLLEKGLLSSIISEVVKGIQPVANLWKSDSIIEEQRMLNQTSATNNKLMQQQRQELEEQKYQMMKEQKRKLLNATGFGSDIFAGTEPIEEAADPSNGQAGALSGIAPNDPGVDINGIMAIANRDWSKMI
jgi:predicted dienelactone hydrolase